MSQNKPRSIEFIARLNKKSEYNDCLKLGKELIRKRKPKLVVHRDIYYNTLRGRLKLRDMLGTNKGKLLQYERSDIPGPKLSNYNVLDVEDINLMEKMLDNSIGSLGYLELIRNLYIYERANIFVDVLKNKQRIFYGMEFEIKLEPGEDIEVGKKIAEDLMKKFKINKNQLLKESYIEVLFPKSDQN
ncbi:hypothetical protein ACKWTF_003933 [Chironomus riparius]